MKRNRGMAVIDVGAAMGDLLQDRIALDDVQSNTFAGGKNPQNDIVGLDDGSQRQNLVVRRANEISGFGCELTQFFELSHRLLQRNKLR